MNLGKSSSNRGFAFTTDVVTVSLFSGAGASFYKAAIWYSQRALLILES